MTALAVTAREPKPMPPAAVKPAAVVEPTWTFRPNSYRVYDKRVNPLPPMISAAYPLACVLQLEIETAMRSNELTALADQAEREARAVLEAVRQDFADHLEMVKLVRLRADTLRTKQEVHQAGAAATAALQAAKQALVDGKDPVAREKAFRDCRLSEEVLVNRVAALEEVTGKQETLCRTLLKDALGVRQRGLYADAQRDYERTADELARAIGDRAAALMRAMHLVQVFSPDPSVLMRLNRSNVIEAYLRLPESAGK